MLAVLPGRLPSHALKLDDTDIYADMEGEGHAARSMHPKRSSTFSSVSRDDPAEDRTSALASALFPSWFPSFLGGTSTWGGGGGIEMSTPRTPRGALSKSRLLLRLDELKDALERERRARREVEAELDEVRRQHLDAISMRWR